MGLCLLISLGAHAMPALIFVRSCASSGKVAAFETARPISVTLALPAPLPTHAFGSGTGRPTGDVGGTARFHSDAVVALSAILHGRVEYPLLARRQGWEGRVTVEATVGSDGHVLSIRTAETSGHRVLDRAAEHAVQTYGFPAGKTSETVRFSFLFRLTER